MSDEDKQPDINPEAVSDFLKACYAVQNILQMWDGYVEVVQVWAKAQKTRFDALIKEGFNAEQALDLVKENIWKTGGF